MSKPITEERRIVILERRIRELEAELAKVRGDLAEQVRRKRVAHEQLEALCQNMHMQRDVALDRAEKAETELARVQERDERLQELRVLSAELAKKLERWREHDRKWMQAAKEALEEKPWVSLSQRKDAL